MLSRVLFSLTPAQALCEFKHRSVSHYPGCGLGRCAPSPISDAHPFYYSQIPAQPSPAHNLLHPISCYTSTKNDHPSRAGLHRRLLHTLLPASLTRAGGRISLPLNAHSGPTPGTQSARTPSRSSSTHASKLCSSRHNHLDQRSHRY